MMADFIRSAIDKVRSYVRRILPTAKEETEFFEKQYAKLPAALRPVAYAVHRAADVLGFGLLRSREVGKELVKEGLLTPRAEKIAGVTGLVAGTFVPFGIASRVLQATRAARLAARSLLGKALRYGAEGALGGAWVETSRAVEEGESPLSGAASGAVAGALWGAVPTYVTGSLLKRLSKIPSPFRGTPEKKQVQSVFTQWIRDLSAAVNKGGVRWAETIYRAAQGNEPLLKAVTVARAWLPDEKFLDPGAWKSDLVGRLLQVEQRALSENSPASAGFIRALREHIQNTPDELITRVSQTIRPLFDQAESLARTLARAKLVNLWERPGERYVPLFITERGLLKRGIQPSGQAVALQFTRRPVRMSVHFLPRGNTLEDALVKYGEDLVLNADAVFPFHYSELRRVLANARFLNRLRAVVARTPEERREALVDLPGQLQEDLKRAILGIAQAQVATIGRKVEAGSPELRALGILEPLLQKKTLSRKVIERAARRLGESPLAQNLRSALDVRGAERRQVVQQVVDRLHEVVQQTRVVAPGRTAKEGSPESQVLGVLESLLQKKTLLRRDIERAAQRLGESPLAQDLRNALAVRGAKRRQAVQQVVDRLREATQRPQVTLAELSEAVSRVQDWLNKLKSERLALPADAQRWLSDRLHQMFRRQGEFERAFYSLARAATRIKVLQPLDWLTQMVWSIGARGSWGETLSPIHRFVSGIKAWWEGRAALKDVSPELDALLEAGLDIGGVGWKRDVFEHLRQPLQSVAGKASQVFDRLTQPIEDLAFGPTGHMRVGLALDLLRRWEPIVGRQEAAKAAASVANFLTGHVNLELLHPWSQWLLRMFVLAPRWLAHTLQLPPRAAGRISEADLSAAAQELVRDFLADYLMRTVYTQFILANMLNRRINNGRNIWENEPGRRHLVDITPLVGLGPWGERQYFDPWFWERDYPRLVQYIIQGDPLRYFEYKVGPLQAVVLDLLGYDVSKGQRVPAGWGERLKAAALDLADTFLPAGTYSIPGAGLNRFGGWAGTPTGRFDPARWGVELLGFRFTPGRAASSPKELRERVARAMDQGLIGVRADRQDVPQLALTPSPEGRVLARIYGKVPGTVETVRSAELLGLPPEQRLKAMLNVFSPESRDLFQKYFGAVPTPRALWELRLIFAQDNPADREVLLKRLTSRRSLEELSRMLNRTPTVGDLIKYHRTLLYRKREPDETLGEGAIARRYLEAFYRAHGR